MPCAPPARKTILLASRPMVGGLLPRLVSSGAELVGGAFDEMGGQRRVAHPDNIDDLAVQLQRLTPRFRTLPIGLDPHQDKGKKRHQQPPCFLKNEPVARELA